MYHRQLISLNPQKRLFAMTDYNLINILDSRDLTRSFTLDQHRGLITCWIILRGADLLTGSLLGELIRWNTNDHFNSVTLHHHRSSILSLIQLQEGTIASGSANTICIWSFYSNQIITIIPVYNPPLRFLRGLNYFLSVSDTLIELYDLKSLRIEFYFSSREMRDYPLVFLNKGVVASFLYTLIQIRRSFFQVGSRYLLGHEAPILSLIAFNLDELISGSVDGNLRIWNYLTFECRYSFMLIGRIDNIIFLGEELFIID